MPFRGDTDWRATGCRDDQSETTSLPRLADHVDASSVLFHDLLDDRKPDSGARFTGFFRLPRPVKLLEDLLNFLMVHADALILYTNPDLRIILTGGNRN